MVRSPPVYIEENCEVDVAPVVVRLESVALVPVIVPALSADVVAPVKTALVAKRLVAVALVMVAEGAKKPPIAERSPEKKPVPATAKVPVGVVVPTPRLPPAVMTVVSAPAALYTSRLLAVEPPAGRSARVLEETLDETIESFAYGVLVPSPTASDEVASVT